MNGNPILEEDENQRIIHALQDLKEPGGKLYDAYSEVKDALEKLALVQRRRLKWPARHISIVWLVDVKR
jgi:hypothetical protein